MNRKQIFNLSLTALFAALIAIGAFIRIPLPPVPFTLQTFFVLLAGLLLGAKRGASSAALYMFIGLCGIPIFTGGGGISYVLNPTFGYILGFIIGAFITGLIAFKVNKPSYPRMIIASLAGLLTVYICGMVYYFLLAQFYIGKPIGLWPLLLNFFIVFLPGDITLALLAVFVSKRLYPTVSAAFSGSVQ